MERLFRNKWNYIFGILLAIFGIGLSFLGLLLSLHFSDNFIFPYHIALISISASYLLFGFLFGDIWGLIYRKKNKNWDDELPEVITDAIWNRKLPFYIASLLMFIVYAIFFIIYLISGSFPFMN